MIAENRVTRNVKVVGEYYRVGGPRGERFDSIGDAVRGAFAMAVRDNYYSISVERVTVHEPVLGREGSFESLCGPISETVTGKISIKGPAHYISLPELSRYHPVNGWVLPDTIEIDF